jgi:hypothetical protein
MNRFEWSAKPSSEREGDQRRLSEFRKVVLDLAGHDLHQPDARCRRRQGAHRLDEPAIARLSEQLDRLAGALRLCVRCD